MSINYFSSAISDSINQVNQEAIRNKQIVGSVVMVAKNREIVYQQASGYANRE